MRQAGEGGGRGGDRGKISLVNENRKKNKHKKEKTRTAEEEEEEEEEEEGGRRLQTIPTLLLHSFYAPAVTRDERITGKVFIYALREGRGGGDGGGGGGGGGGND
ncbi:hypothetical protein E2C01_086606 [Portunus trituberculatus]|uniref:Uncharacterized protein n=1 Tax=Portunus trituberculatus TaxID=210409 RepID=A0A5B7J1A0_PORTR|nr:hypothetical protein [Portunus trituberculatus]